MKKLLLFLFLSIFNWVIAQTNVPEVIPASPNAASLGKFGEVPVGFYTGIPKINIPLYNILVDNVEVPIELDYHAGGVKVEEIASWVGLGWSLNAGGVITRTVRGKDDLTSLNYYEVVDDFISRSTQRDYGTFVPKTDAQRQYLDNANNSFDTEPDIFYFNFGSYSGKFALFPDGNYYCLPLTNLKIERGSVIGGKNRWVLTTDDGTKYFFGAKADGKEQAIESTITTENISGFYENSWYLVEIITPNKRNIEFKYDKESYAFYTAPIVTKYTRLTPTGATGESYDETRQLHTISTVRLNSVEFDNGIIKFEALLHRYDLDGTGALTSMYVYSNGRDGMKEIKRTNFRYSYFTSTGTVSDASLKASGIDMNNKDINTNYYLKLDSIIEQSGNERSAPFSFVYETKSLPGRMSASIDHWGFFNGKSNGESRLPNTYYLMYNSGVVDYEYSSSEADRDPDENFMKASSLVQVNYPTGGNTKFLYEANVADAKISSQPLYTINGNHVSSTSTIVDKSASCFLYSSENHQGVEDTSDVVEFELKEGATVSFYASMSGRLNTFVPYCFSLEVRNVKTNTGNSYAITRLSGVTFVSSLKLNSGKYKMYLTKDNGGDCANTDFIVMRGNAKWSEVVTDTVKQPKNIVVGGLRIKSIDNYDITSNRHLIKDFFYTNFDDTTLSSGSVISYPVYLFRLFGTQQYETQGLNSKYSAIYQTTSSYPLQTTSGSVVGYANVMVKSYSQNSNTDNGYSRYYYTSPKDFPDSIYDGKQYPKNLTTNYSLPLMPYEILSLPPSTFPSYGSVDWRRGLLLKSEDYIRKGTAYKLGKVMENKYSTISSPLLKKNAVGLKYYLIESPVFSIQSILIQPSIYLCNLSNTPSEFTYLSSSNEKTFDESNKELIVHKEYSFNEINNLRLSEELEVGSKNDTVRTYNYYSTGKAEIKNNYPINSLTSIALDSMLKRNNKSAIVLQNVYLSNKLLSSTFNNYNLYNKVPLKSAVSQKIKDNPYLDLFYYNKYDSYGNILELQKANGIKEIYLWGYRGKYPVAKIIGSDFNTVNSHIDTALLNNGTEAQIEGQLSSLRTFLKSLPLSFISTYTYAPLVGLITETDPTGKITHYGYDSFGKLKNINDNNGKVIKTFDYNYQVH